ncbi:hypothetical protein BD779DRAFT_1666398 [Infundibulicybe gibba]|nr:hypothetical protein BD779DRAFT_1666398 [Infundibulicybe gibba]
MPNINDLHNPAGMFSQPLPVAGPSVDRSTIRGSPAEEEMEDGEEWTVKVGDAPPPTWGKRRASEEVVDKDGNKRSKPNETGTPAELNAQALVVIANMHVIDQSIRDIAKEFRFTVEEVQEYYDKCGEMGRTRTRFQRMREELRAKFPDDDT